VIKVAGEAKKLRNNIDETIKRMQTIRKQELTLIEIIEAHLELASNRVNLDDSYRTLRQICLKGLS